jgi:hypothetical protein
MAALTGMIALLAGGLALLWGVHLATEAVVVSRNLSVTAWILVTGVLGGGTVLLGLALLYGVAGSQVLPVTAVGLVVGSISGGYTGRVRRRRGVTERGTEDCGTATAGNSFEGTGFEPAVTLDQATGSDTQRDRE